MSALDQLLAVPGVAPSLAWAIVLGLLRWRLRGALDDDDLIVARGKR